MLEFFIMERIKTGGPEPGFPKKCQKANRVDLTLKFSMILVRNYKYMNKASSKIRNVIPIAIAEGIWKLEIPYLCNIKKTEMENLSNYHKEMLILEEAWK